jgi:hypothetical protein
VCVQRLCLRDIAVRTSTTNVKALVKQALAYLDDNKLWTHGDGSFPAELLKPICDSLKPHDYQVRIARAEWI